MQQKSNRTNGTNLVYFALISRIFLFRYQNIGIRLLGDSSFVLELIK